MPTETVKGRADVKVESSVYVTVSCSECGEKLTIDSIGSGERYHEDEVFVTVKPHTCPKEEETSG